MSLPIVHSYTVHKYLPRANIIASLVGLFEHFQKFNSRPDWRLQLYCTPFYNIVDSVTLQYVSSYPVVNTCTRVLFCTSRTRDIVQSVINHGLVNVTGTSRLWKSKKTLAASLIHVVGYPATAPP